MNFANAQLKWKFTTGFLGVSAILLLMCGVVYMNLTTISARTTELAQARNLQLAAKSELMDRIDIQDAMRGYVASGSISFLRNVDSLRSDAAEQERRLDELSAGDSDLRAKLVEEI